MINANKTLTLALAVLLTGCGLSVPGLDNSNDSASNSSEYKMVLDENYDGYGDDNDLTSAEIDEGAENFAQCENATECSLLWDTAKEWLTEKSTYKSALETNKRNLLETKVDTRRKKADKITIKI